MSKQIADILNQPAFDRLKDWYDIGPVQKATLELFAELIVWKCADIANAGIDPAESHLIGDDILEHFGVEE